MGSDESSSVRVIHETWLGSQLYELANYDVLCIGEIEIPSIKTEKATRKCILCEFFSSILLRARLSHTIQSLDF